MNNSEEYRKLLIKEIEATGKYLLENAKKLVKDVDFIRDFNINLNFPSMDDMGSCPTIEICQTCFNDSAVKVNMNAEYGTLFSKTPQDLNPSFGAELVKGLGQFVCDNTKKPNPKAKLSHNKVSNNDQT